MFFVRIRSANAGGAYEADEVVPPSGSMVTSFVSYGKPCPSCASCAGDSCKCTNNAVSTPRVLCANDNCRICSGPTGAVCYRAMPGLDLLGRAAGLVLASLSMQAGNADSAARVVDDGNAASGSSSLKRPAGALGSLNAPSSSKRAKRSQSPKRQLDLSGVQTRAARGRVAKGLPPYSRGSGSGEQSSNRKDSSVSVSSGTGEGAQRGVSKGEGCVVSINGKGKRATKGKGGVASLVAAAASLAGAQAMSADSGAGGSCGARDASNNGGSSGASSDGRGSSASGSGVSSSAGSHGGSRNASSNGRGSNASSSSSSSNASSNGRGSNASSNSSSSYASSNGRGSNASGGGVSSSAGGDGFSSSAGGDGGSSNAGGDGGSSNASSNGRGSNASSNGGGRNASLFPRGAAALCGAPRWRNGRFHSRCGETWLQCVKARHWAWRGEIGLPRRSSSPCVTHLDRTTILGGVMQDACDACREQRGANRPGRR